MARTRTKYGITNWPDRISDVQIELELYRHNKKYRAASGKVFPASEHFINATRMLFSNEQLSWNRWTEDHAMCFVQDKFAVVWGPGAAQKSNDFGCFCVVDWWADPANTYTAVCSTTSSMLKKRIWEAVQRYHSYHKNSAPGRHLKSRFAILLNADETKSDTEKPGIHGFAVMAGSAEETQANIVGVHVKRVRLLIDEMQSTRRAAVDARHNLSKGVEDFKLIGLCNPTSFLNIAGEYSEPLDGYESISVESESWETKWGKCYHYDAHKSPAVLEEGGAEKYPHVINQEQIDEHAKEGVDSAHYWIYVRGFPPPSGIVNTVLNQAECNAFGVFNDVVWRDNQTIKLGTLDPAFGGEDKCRFKIWEANYSTSGVYTCKLMESFTLEVRVGQERPPTYQIADQVKDLAQIYGLIPEHFALDESVTQSVGDVIEEVWVKGDGMRKIVGPGIHRINFGAKPIDGIKSVDSNLLCEDEYFNLISSLYLQFAVYCKYGQIRGLDRQSARELCTRVVKEGKPAAIESKSDFKKRMSKSPDDSDCCAMLAYLLRKVVGVIPGAISTTANDRPRNAPPIDLDIDASDNNYLDSSL